MTENTTTKRKTQELEEQKKVSDLHESDRTCSKRHASTDYRKYVVGLEINRNSKAGTDKLPGNDR